jgi:type III pantothenate kinase
MLIRNLCQPSPDWESIEGIIISSVVPALNGPLTAMAERYFSTRPLFVSAEIHTGIKILYDNPQELGTDRIVNSAAAFSRYGGPVLVVDLGTAINFDVVSADGKYLGGLICPGIGMSIQALRAKTARLPVVELGHSAEVIGKNTVQCVRSGVYYGFAAMIDGVAERVVSALGQEVKVIVTGGQARFIAGALRFVDEIDEDLTLEGLELLWRWNRDIPLRSTAKLELALGKQPRRVAPSLVGHNGHNRGVLG